MKILRTKVEIDEFTTKVSKAFDYEFTGESEFAVPEFPTDKLPEDFQIGLIVGASGSGKSSILREYFNEEENIEWDNKKAIVSNFTTPDEAIDRLGAVGLNSIPSWCKPFNVLSNGEQFRANLARRLHENSVIDEFTSVVDRNVAKACSASVSKYIRKKDLKNIVFASCHEDIIEWLEPDWVFNCNTGELLVGRSLWHRPEIKLDIYETDWHTWKAFAKYHYLSADINKACKCYVAYWGDVPVGFVASLSMFGRIPPLYEGDTRGKYRESRVVINPDYQGMSLGTKLSEAIAQMFLDEGYRYFCKTAHIRMGEHRQHSDLWRPTDTNLKSREKSQKCSKKEAYKHYLLDTRRICFSHEYIGPIGNIHRDKYEKQKRKDKETKRFEKQKKQFMKAKKKRLDK